MIFRIKKKSKIDEYGDLNLPHLSIVWNILYS